MKRPVVLMLGPHRNAVSGISTHLNLLFSSRLAEEFSLVHFQVGSEGHVESTTGRLLRLVLSPLSLAATILSRDAAVVHLNTSLNFRAYWRDLAYLVVARLCGARVVYQVHGGALPQEFLPQGRIPTAFLKWTLRLPDAIVVLAQAELKAYRRFVPGQQVLAYPNGIDCAEYARLARVPSTAAAPLRLLYVGRLAWEKGVGDALQGLKAAHRQGVRACMVVAGSGPDEVPLRRLTHELGLAAHVSFVGAVFGGDKLRVLGTAEVLVLTSYSEGLPYALLEGMAAGAAVIATRVGAIPDVVIEGVHGLFVPPRDPQAIADAIGTLAADRDALEQMREACRGRVAGGYSMERLCGELSRLYQGICLADTRRRPAGHGSSVGE